MNNKKYKLVFVLALFAFILSGCTSYYRNMPFISIPIQPVSDLIEIIPPEPLKPHGRTNWFNLGCEGYKEIRLLAENKEDILELADGRSTKIEAFLFDDRGQMYELELSLSSSRPELHKKGAVEFVNGIPDYSATKFPSDRVFTRLRIRSETLLKCNKIEWIGSNPN